MKGDAYKMNKTIETYKQDLETLIDRANVAADIIAASAIVEEIKFVMSRITKLEQIASC